ncbi:MAG: acyl-CoA thioesterase II [Halioglobus sp.]
MYETLDRLIDVISPQAESECVYTGHNMHPEAFRVYGGQVLAQCLSAAAATVAPGRQVHSQHAYFLRPGDPSLPITLEVEKARDGGSFSSRRVVANQQGKTILVSSLSFQTPAEGDEFQSAMPQVPAPEELVSERELGLQAGNIDEKFMITTGQDLDVRVVEPIDWESPVAREPVLKAWVKTVGPVADAAGRQQALLAYISDFFLIDVCLIAHGRDYQDTSLQVASLDHALWFHTDFRADEWLLHVVEASAIGGGRGLAHGSFYTREGKLVANTVQQGLMRKR